METLRVEPAIAASKTIYYPVKAIRQWDQALRERNDYRDALAKVQRQHEEAVKEINQAMAVRIKVCSMYVLFRKY